MNQERAAGFVNGKEVSKWTKCGSFEIRCFWNPMGLFINCESLKLLEEIFYHLKSALTGITCKTNSYPPVRFIDFYRDSH